MTAYIPVSDDQFAVIDLEDAHLVIGPTWHLKRGPHTSYAVAWIDGKKVRMHHIIKPGIGLTDHANRDGLDNRKSNLRASDKQRNGFNARPDRVWKGVFYNVKRKRWECHMTVDGARLFLGRFDTAEEAAKVRDAAVREWVGDSGIYNFQREI